MNQIIVNYMTLRKAIGWMGLTLPLALVLREWVSVLYAGVGQALLPSMSAYYYASARDLFVGDLAAIGLFLGLYNGYDSRDRWTSAIAGAAATGVAMFPMAPAGAAGLAVWCGWAHFICALAFFGALAWFCLVLFPKTSGDLTPEKLIRNEVYKTCGYVIVAGVVLLAVVAMTIDHSPWVFWIEAAMVAAFGFSWLVKGEAFLADQGVA